MTARERQAELVLTDEEREPLARWARGRSVAGAGVAFADRAGVRRWCDNKEWPPASGLGADGVQWRSRFVQDGSRPAGRRPSPGPPAVDHADQVEDVVVATLESTPANATTGRANRWPNAAGCPSPRSGESGRPSTCSRIARDYRLSNDPLLVEGLRHHGLYVDPPESAVVYCIDEEVPVQALARSQPAFPMMPGMPKAHPRLRRNGTTSLFAAFNITDGTAILALPRRHRAMIRSSWPSSTPRSPPTSTCTDLRQLRHPQVPRHAGLVANTSHALRPIHFHWLNQVERMFALLTRRLLERGDHRSVRALEAEMIRTWVAD